MCDLVCDPKEQGNLDLASIAGFKVKIANSRRGSKRYNETAKRRAQLVMLSDRFSLLSCESESPEKQTEEVPTLAKNGTIYVGIIIKDNHPVRKLVRDSLVEFFPTLASLSLESSGAEIETPKKKVSIIKPQASLVEVPLNITLMLPIFTDSNTVLSGGTPMEDIEGAWAQADVDFPVSKSESNTSNTCITGTGRDGTGKGGRRPIAYNPQSRNAACIKFDSSAKSKLKLYDSDDSLLSRSDEWIINEGRERLEEAFYSHKPSDVVSTASAISEVVKHQQVALSVSSFTDVTTPAARTPSAPKTFHGRPLIIISGRIPVPPTIIPSFPRIHSLYLMGEDMDRDSPRGETDPRKTLGSLWRRTDVVPYDFILPRFASEVSAPGFTLRDTAITSKRMLPPKSPVGNSSESLPFVRSIDETSFVGSASDLVPDIGMDLVNLLQNLTDQVNLEIISATEKDDNGLNNSLGQCIGTTVKPSYEYDRYQQAQKLVQNLITMCSNKEKVSSGDSSRKNVSEVPRTSLLSSDEIQRIDVEKKQELLDMVTKLVSCEDMKDVEGQSGATVRNSSVSGRVQEMTDVIGCVKELGNVRSVRSNSMEQNNLRRNGRQIKSSKSTYEKSQDVAQEGKMDNFDTLETDIFLDKGIYVEHKRKQKYKSHRNKKGKYKSKERRSQMSTYERNDMEEREIGEYLSASSVSRRSEREREIHDDKLRGRSFNRPARTPSGSPLNRSCHMGYTRSGSPRESSSKGASFNGGSFPQRGSHSVDKHPHSPTASVQLNDSFSDINDDDDFESRYRSIICKPKESAVNASTGRSRSVTSNSHLTKAANKEKEFRCSAKALLKMFVAEIDKSLEAVDPEMTVNIMADVRMHCSRFLKENRSDDEST